MTIRIRRAHLEEDAGKLLHEAPVVREFAVKLDAPVDRVYAFWSTYENYPLFMANVREVQDLGGGRSRWLLTTSRFWQRMWGDIWVF